MDCNETRLLLEADLDGELELVRHLDLQAHLRACPHCAGLVANARLRRSAIQDALPRYAAPPQLAERIRVSLAASIPVSPARPSLSPAKFIFPLWGIAGIAASLILAVFAGFAWGNSRARVNLLVDEGVAEHIRSLEAAHLTDVASTDQHTVKPWFAGKLDFSPPVFDLSAAGFPLAGGRLEHFDGRPAAALVFHRRQHAINLFVWPAGNTSLPSHPRAHNGYHLQAWSHAGLNFLAVSEISADELAQFAEIFRANLP